MLEVSEREEGVVALHLPIVPVLGCRRYRDANPVPTSPLDDDKTSGSSRRGWGDYLYAHIH